MSDERTYPTLRQVVLDSTDARGLAEFYRQLLGLEYRPGDEPPPTGGHDPQAREWLALRKNGESLLAVQPVDHLPAATWPEGPVPQQLHLDCTVPDTDELQVQHQRALSLGATLLLDRSADEDEPLYVYADPAGHPFCIFVG